MSEQRTIWVVDASVATSLFIEGPLSDHAHRFFTLLADKVPAHFYVPDLFYIEVANTLWKYVRWQGLAQAQAQIYLAQLGRLALTTVSTAELMAAALDLAAAHSLSAYDGCYLALAQRLNATLVTADQKLVTAVAGAVEVMALADLSLSP